MKLFGSNYLINGIVSYFFGPGCCETIINTLKILLAFSFLVYQEQEMELTPISKMSHV